MIIAKKRNKNIRKSLKSKKRKQNISENLDKIMICRMIIISCQISKTSIVSLNLELKGSVRKILIMTIGACLSNYALKILIKLMARTNLLAQRN